jgi:uncharacterized cupredoxin-like copper-binding protein
MGKVRTMKNIRGLLLMSATVLLAACGKPQVVKVTETEYELKLDQNTVAPGDVTFTVTNGGHAHHSLVVLKTDLPVDGLPVITNADNTTVVDERSPEVEHLTPEVEDVLGGGTKSATLELTPGKYAVICNEPDHYRNGMYAALSVK